MRRSPCVDAVRIGLRLWRTLRRLPKPDLVLVQNPPAFPTLTVTRLALADKGVRFVIDWHNIGYTMLRLRLGQWHPAVRLARWLERRDARHADAHLCVSRGLAEFLKSRFGLQNTHVLYDRPASIFVPIERVDRERYRQALLTRLGVQAGAVGFIVCPTSWTEDEDFDVVIDAVLRLEDRIRGWEAAGSGRRFPDLAILVTGDGARRMEFERRFAGLPARRVHLRARWLEPEDYPRVVGSADLGLCLHRSSSGLDIPMKVADLFGAGVPVCALDYGATLAERVRHGSNGLLFSTAEQLASILFDLFEDVPRGRSDVRAAAQRRAQVGAHVVGRGVAARGAAGAASGERPRRCWSSADGASCLPAPSGLPRFTSTADGSPRFAASTTCRPRTPAGVSRSSTPATGRVAGHRRLARPRQRARPDRVGRLRHGHAGGGRRRRDDDRRHAAQQRAGDDGCRGARGEAARGAGPVTWTSASGAAWCRASPGSARGDRNALDRSSTPACAGSSAFSCRQASTSSSRSTSRTLRRRAADARGRHVPLLVHAELPDRIAPHAGTARRATATTRRRVRPPPKSTRFG